MDNAQKQLALVKDLEPNFPNALFLEEYPLIMLMCPSQIESMTSTTGDDLVTTQTLDSSNTIHQPLVQTQSPMRTQPPQHLPPLHYYTPPADGTASLSTTKDSSSFPHFPKTTKNYNSSNNNLINKPQNQGHTVAQQQSNYDPLESYTYKPLSDAKPIQGNFTANTNPSNMPSNTRAKSGKLLGGATGNRNPSKNRANQTQIIPQQQQQKNIPMTFVQQPSMPPSPTGLEMSVQLLEKKS